MANEVYTVFHLLDQLLHIWSFAALWGTVGMLIMLITILVPGNIKKDRIVLAVKVAGSVTATFFMLPALLAVYLCLNR